MANASRDENSVPTLIGASNVDGKTPVKVYADPVTHRLLVDSAGGGTGTVTSITAGTGLTATPSNPITTTGTIALDSKLSPLDTLGTAGQLIRVNAGATALEYFTASAGGVASVVGTANRITVDSTDPANPIVDIAATYVGQSSITILGTVTTGTWSATTIALNKGGTGQTTKAAAFDALSPMTTGGDIIYGGASGTGTRLANGSAGQVLTSAGTTLAPTWATPTTGTVTSVTSANTALATVANSTTTPAITIVAAPAITSATTTINTSSATAPTSGQVLTATSGTAATWQTPTTGTVTSVSGTTNRITSTGGATPVIDISASYVGQSSITTLGTITTGVWTGTTIAIANGGTGATTLAGASIPTYTSTITFTNKRITRRVVATTQSATPTINTDNTDMSSITALAQAITSMTTNLSGTPVQGDFLEIQITDNGTARAITWGTSFVASTVALPTTTVISTLLHVLFEWDSTSSKWICVAVA